MACDVLMLLGGQAFKQQQSDQPASGQDNLFEPAGSTEGEFGYLTRSSSLYTRHLELHPNRKRLVLGAAVLAMAAFVRRVWR